MARGINKVILIGNLGNDPDVRYTPSGSAIANISVATSEGWRDKQSGELQERTEWHRVALFNRLAEIAGEYLKKGAKVYIEGSLRTRKWTDKNNLERYTTEIVASDMQMLDSRGGVGAAGNASSGGFASGGGGSSFEKPRDYGSNQSFKQQGYDDASQEPPMSPPTPPSVPSSMPSSTDESKHEHHEHDIADDDVPF